MSTEASLDSITVELDSIAVEVGSITAGVLSVTNVMSFVPSSLKLVSVGAIFRLIFSPIKRINVIIEIE